MVAIEVVLAVAVAYIVYKIINEILKFLRYYRHISKIPGIKAIFPFGTVYPFLFASVEEYDKIFKREVDECRKRFPNASVIRGWNFQVPIIFATKAKSAEIILKSSEEIRKGPQYELLRPWLGDGLLISSGDKWRRRRKLLTPSFHFNILENFIPIFNEQSRILVEIMNEKAGKGSFDVYPLITMLTLDIICATAMGKKINAQRNPESDYVKAVKTLSEHVLQLMFKRWLLIPFVFYFTSMKKENDRCLKIVHDFTYRVIKERIEEIERNKRNKKYITTKDENEFGIKRRIAFLDALLEEMDMGEYGLTDEELREEVDTFMFEGHDTTAASLTSTLIYLGNNPSAQEKIHKELDEVFGSDERPLTSKDLTQLKYLEAAIKESLRLSPPVPIYGRELINDIEIDGMTIPAGVSINVAAFAIHRDPEYFENPDEFNIERFYGDSDGGRHPFSFIPFSAGARNCIGQRFALIEEKIIMAHILRRFKINSAINLDDVKVSPFIVMRPLCEITISLEKK